MIIWKTKSNGKRNGKKNWRLWVTDQGCIWSSSISWEAYGWLLLLLFKRLNGSAQVQNFTGLFKKTFYSKKRIPLIPPLLANNSCATDFKEKANLLNESFCKQYTPVANDSTLPPLL